MAKHTIKKIRSTAAEVAYEMPADFGTRKLKHISGGLDGLLHYAKTKRAARTVELAPDVFKAFPTADVVNDALRRLIRDGAKPKRRKTA